MWSFLRFFLASFRHAPWDTGISPPELLGFIQSHPPGRALDLGCGTGTNVITLAQHGWQAVGVDFIPRSIHTARRKAMLAGVDAYFQVDTVTNLASLYNPYDLILDIGCYHSLSAASRKAYRSNIDRLLSPGGTLLIYGFLADPFSKSSFGIAASDLDEFTEFTLLKKRTDGLDHNRASAWFEFHRPRDPIRMDEKRGLA